MATLTQPENTGTLDREAVQAAARDAAALDRRVEPEELARHAAELRAWLDSHGTDAGARPTDDDVQLSPRVIDLRDPSSFPAGRPGILVHQHVWMPTGERFEPTAHADLETLVDQALALLPGTQDSTTPERFVALPTRDLDERSKAGRRTLGWAAVVGLWAAAAAMLVPLAIWGVIGAFDMTVDLSGDDPVAEQVATEDAPVAPVADADLAAN